MSRYSPTALKMYGESCPRALDHYTANAPIDRSVFHVGTVAHAIIEDIGNAATERGHVIEGLEAERVADASMSRLLTDGRRHEPPPPPDAATEGRLIALAWNERHPLLPDARHELRAAFDREWRAVPWDDGGARLRMVMDCQFVTDETDEEGFGGVFLVVRDYKSAWPAGPKELGINGSGDVTGDPSIQMRAQAVAAWLAVESDGDSRANAIRLEIGNLRTRRIWSRDLRPWSDGEDGDALLRWRDELESIMSSADAQAERGPRPARVGGGCIGCAYVLRCEEAKEWAEDVADDAEPAHIVKAFAAAQARRDALAALAREATKEGPFPLLDGFSVGFVGKDSKSATDDAGTVALGAWLDAVANIEADAAEIPAGAVRGLLTAMGGLSVSQLTKLAKRIAEDKEEREAWLATVLEVNEAPRFGVHRTAP